MWRGRMRRTIDREALFDLASYDYPLTEDRIAQAPVEPRDSSRLLVWSVASGETQHMRFRDIVELLRPEDLLVLNDTRVLPARLIGTRPGGGKAEALLLRPEDADMRAWRALVRPGRKLRTGSSFVVGDRAIEIEGEAPDGVRIVRVGREGEGREDVLAFLEASGHVPLPPYISPDGGGLSTRDLRDAYQTVFARRDGSVAAPTASLHFTPRLLDEIDARGVGRAWATLHVGLGTFRPVKAQDVREHPMHHELCEIPEATAEAVREHRARGGRIVAAGTTVARALESMAIGDGLVRPGRIDTDLFILPGHRFRVVDALITNFHLPRSSLLMLVAALASCLGGWEGEEERGVSELLSVYEEAIAEGYRFFSFGDAMFIQR